MKVRSRKGKSRNTPYQRRQINAPNVPKELPEPEEYAADVDSSSDQGEGTDYENSATAPLHKAKLATGKPNYDNRGNDEINKAASGSDNADHPVQDLLASVDKEADLAAEASRAINAVKAALAGAGMGSIQAALAGAGMIPVQAALAGAGLEPVQAALAGAGLRPVQGAPAGIGMGAVQAALAGAGMVPVRAALPGAGIGPLVGAGFAPVEVVPGGAGQAAAANDDSGNEPDRNDGVAATDEESEGEKEIYRVEVARTMSDIVHTRDMLFALTRRVDQLLELCKNWQKKNLAPGKPKKPAEPKEQQPPDGGVEKPSQ